MRAKAIGSTRADQSTVRQIRATAPRGSSDYVKACPVAFFSALFDSESAYVPRNRGHPALSILRRSARNEARSKEQGARHEGNHEMDRARRGRHVSVARARAIWVAAVTDGYHTRHQPSVAHVGNWGLYAADDRH